MIEQVKHIVDNVLARRGIVPDFEQVLRIQVNAKKRFRRFPAFNQHLFLLNAGALPVGMTITSDSNILVIDKHLQMHEVIKDGVFEVHEFSGDVLIEVNEEMGLHGWNTMAEEQKDAILEDRDYTWNLLFYHVIPKIF